jgi:hypothetical protein
MAGLETGLLGAAAALILAVAILSMVLYLVPIPLWIAAGPQGPTLGC